MPFSASFLATDKAVETIVPQAMIVTSLPSRSLLLPPIVKGASSLYAIGQLRFPVNRIYTGFSLAIATWNNLAADAPSAGESI